MNKIKFLRVFTEVMDKFHISAFDCVLGDLIFHLSNNPSSAFPGWCYMSKNTLADYLNTGRTTIYESMDRLIKSGLLDRNDETGYLKMTKKWFDSISFDSNNDCTDSVHSVRNMDSTCTDSVQPPCTDSVHYINKKNSKIKDNNTASPLYKYYVEEYKIFCEKVARTIFDFRGGADGKAMKEIIALLDKAHDGDSQTAFEAWKAMLCKYESWETFHKKNLRVVQIRSNLMNIINHLKNGKSAKADSARQAASEAMDRLRSGKY